MIRLALERRMGTRRCEFIAQDVFLLSSIPMIQMFSFITNPNDSDGFLSSSILIIQWVVLLNVVHIHSVFLTL